MIPEVYNFQTTVQGDLYPETTINFADADNNVLDLTGYSVTIAFERNPECEEIPISISDPENGEIRIPAFTPDWTPGKWEYQLKLIDPTDGVQTYLKGSLSITRSIECP